MEIENIKARLEKLVSDFLFYETLDILFRAVGNEIRHETVTKLVEEKEKELARFGVSKDSVISILEDCKLEDIKNPKVREEFNVETPTTSRGWTDLFIPSKPKKVTYVRLRFCPLNYVEVAKSEVEEFKALMASMAEQLTVRLKEDREFQMLVKCRKQIIDKIHETVDGVRNVIAEMAKTKSKEVRE